ncbi:MAG TPA: DUF3597 domain-containing protein [Xanthobacteraceae bacterium]|nr:DUF3597 domain-containing protein [Xanthobacteraceae bacterium]
MSVFGKIMSAIFGHAGTSPASAQPTPSATQPATPGQQSPSATQSTPPGPTPASMAPSSSVDVEAVLTRLNAQKKQKLDWRHSIVDLMKLLDLDSGLAARKELAKELHYTGDTKDSAKMNIWLHRQVMIKLAENGGKVPAELKKAG